QTCSFTLRRVIPLSTASITIYYYFLSISIRIEKSLRIYRHTHTSVYRHLPAHIIHTLTHNGCLRPGSCTLKNLWTQRKRFVVLDSCILLWRSKEEILLNELINLITQKTGISKEMAEQA